MVLEWRIILRKGIVMNNELKRKWDMLLDGLLYKVKDRVLTEEEISIYEANNKITLPEDYRYFLMNVGNGIIIKNGIFEMTLGYIERPIDKNINNRLKLEFPFNEPYKLNYDYPKYYYEGKNFKNQECLVAKDNLKYTDKEAIEKCKGCPYVDECNDAEWQVFYDDIFEGYLDEGTVPYHNGSIVILNMGFEDEYRLIITGSHKGEVWLNYWETEFVPVTKTFYELILAYKNKDKVLRDKTGGVNWMFND